MLKECYLIILLIISILTGCRQGVPTNRIDSDIFDSDTLVWVKNWNLLGPLTTDSVNNISEHDFFLNIGWKEEYVNKKSYLQAIDRLITKNGLIKSENVESFIQGIYFEERFKPKTQSCVYLACIIQSSVTKEVAACFSTYQIGKIWLNGNLIYRSEWKYSHTQDFVPLSLNNGDNFILIKVSFTDPDYSPERWRFGFALGSNTKMQKMFKEMYDKRYLQKSVLTRNEPIMLYASMYMFENVRLKIRNSNEQIDAFADSLKIDKLTGMLSYYPQKRLNGIYDCIMFTENDSLKQSLYFGNIDSAFINLRNRFEKITIDSDDKKNAEILFERLQYVLDKRRASSTPHRQLTKLWDLDRVSSLKDIEKIVNGLENNKNPFKMGAGHFRIFQSSYDSTEYCYFQYSPFLENDNKKLPLFIILQIETENYTKKWLYHWCTLNGINTNYENLADRYNFSFILTDCGSSVGNDVKFNMHFSDILKNAVRELPVDSNKIFVITNCSSTGYAFKIINSQQEKISGIGFINPEPTVKYELLRKDTFPDAYVLCSFFDEMIPFKQSKMFYDRIFENNPNAVLEISYETSHHRASPSYAENMFSYFVSNN